VALDDDSIDAAAAYAGEQRSGKESTRAQCRCAAQGHVVAAESSFFFFGPRPGSPASAREPAKPGRRSRARDDRRDTRRSAADAKTLPANKPLAIAIPEQNHGDDGTKEKKSRSAVRGEVIGTLHRYGDDEVDEL